MGAISVLPRDIHQKPVIIISKYNEILYANELAKTMLVERNDEEYRLSALQEFEFTAFICQVRTQHYAVTHFSINNEIHLVEGFYDPYQETVTVFLNLHKWDKPIVTQKTIDSLDVGVIAYTNDGVIVNANAKIKRLLSKRTDQIILQNIKDFKKYIFYNEIEWKQLNKQLREQGKGSIIVKKNTDEELFFKLKIQYNSEQALYYMSIVEYTECMQLRCQLQEQHLLKEIGLMSASVAHEIRNPLTILKGFSDLLKNTAMPEQLPYFHIMDKEFHRLDVILTDLLYLSRPKPQMPKVIDLGEVVKEVIELMAIEASQQNILLQLEVAEEQPFMMKGSVVRLKQVLMNLVKNALEAMEEGKITISLQQEKSWIQLAIQDEGVGMSEEICQSIFEPFFTTKEKGTGLGLSLVKKMIEECNGSIEVESCPNIGTTFYIVFPGIEVANPI